MRRCRESKHAASWPGHSSRFKVYFMVHSMIHSIVYFNIQFKVLTDAWYAHRSSTMLYTNCCCSSAEMLHAGSYPTWFHFHNMVCRTPAVPYPRLSHSPCRCDPGIIHARRSQVLCCSRRTPTATQGCVPNSMIGQRYGVRLWGRVTMHA